MSGFFAVHIEDLESDAFKDASPEQVSTWLFLHALCFKEANGGRVEGARDKPRHYWQRRGIDPDLLVEVSPLWTWEGNALVLTPYDHQAEANAAVWKEKSRKMHEARWGKGGAASSSASSTTPSSAPKPQPQPKPQPKPKETHTQPYRDPDEPDDDSSASVEDLLAETGFGDLGVSLKPDLGGDSEKRKLMELAMAAGCSQAGALLAADTYLKQNGCDENGVEIANFEGWARNMEKGWRKRVNA